VPRNGEVVGGKVEMQINKNINTGYFRSFRHYKLCDTETEKKSVSYPH